MPKYYFDVFDGADLSVDTVGDEFECDQAAVDQAVSLIPALANDHIPKKRNITVTTSLRSDDGSIIYRSIGLIISSQVDRERVEPSIDAFQDHTRVINTIKLREEMRALREKIRVDISDIFSQLERLAEMDETRQKSIEDGSGRSN